MERNSTKPMPGKPADSRSTKSRAALRAALLVMLRQKPLADITVRDLTFNADIGYATFFRHYPNLESLLEDVAKEQIDQVIGAVLPVMGTANALDACKALCAVVGAHRAVWVTLLTGGAFDAVKQELLLLSREYAAMQTGLTSWLPPDLGVSLSVSCTLELLVWWLTSPNPDSSDNIGQLLHKVIHERLLISETFN